MSQAQNWHEQYTPLFLRKKDRIDENPNIPRGFVKFLHFLRAGYAGFFVNDNGGVRDSGLIHGDVRV